MTLRRVIFRLLLAGSVVLPLAARAEGAGAFFSRGANTSKWGGYAHAALADLTPYLAGFAAGLFLLSLALLFCEARPLVRVRHRFRALPRFQQVLLVLSIGVMTASAQKSGTHEASVVLPMPAALNAVDGEEEDFLATNIFPATNVFAITSFAVDRARCEVSFEASWTSTFFDSVDSRNVDLFSSTNLLERRWTPFSAANAGDFLRTDCGAAFGTGLAQDATSASVVSLANGATLPDEFVSRMTANGDQGIVLVEGRAAGSGLEVQGFCDSNSTATVEGALDVRVSSVEDMYRFGSLRGAESGANFAVALPGVPSNLMTGGKDLDVFFTHGFNVSEQDAHAWGAEVFKRLWQSGSNARFWMVTWAGDYNWIGSAFNGLHYQQDVYQALKTGAAFKSFVEAAQPVAAKRVVMTQSLGNMVACEALRQGLNVGKYFMFNAAVPSEAIDGTLQDADAATRAKYVPSDWDGYDPRSWASNWHRWFKDDATDARGKMGWPDYFATALSRAGTVYNYYSSGDAVFSEEDSVPGVATGVFHWPTLSLSWPFIEWNITTEANSWQKQETHKGVEPIAGTLYGGWGFYCWQENVGGEPLTRYYSATEANAMVASGAVTNRPIFSCSGTPLNNRNASQDDVWLSLAKYVPAISSPIGGCAAFGNPDRAADLNSSSYRNGWGRTSSVYGASWLHSDMKDMSYYHVYPLYDEIVQKGGLK